MKFKDIKVHDINEKPDRAFMFIIAHGNNTPYIHPCKYMPDACEIAINYRASVLGWIYADPEVDFRPDDGSWWLCRATDLDGVTNSIVAKYEMDTNKWVINTVNLTFREDYDALTPIKEINL